MSKKKVVEFSAYYSKKAVRTIEVKNSFAPIIHFDLYLQQKDSQSPQVTEFKSPRVADLRECKRRIANGDYVINPDALAESIFNRLMSEDADTSELPRLTPDGS